MQLPVSSMRVWASHQLPQQNQCSGQYSQASQRTRAFYSTSLVEAAYFEAYHDLPIHRITLASELNFEAYHRQGPISNARGKPKGIYLMSPNLKAQNSFSSLLQN
jgi:hypothetical protein